MGWAYRPMVFRGPRAAAPTVALHSRLSPHRTALLRFLTLLRHSRCSSPNSAPLRLGRDQSGAGGPALAPALLSTKPSAWRLGAAAGGAWHNAARMPMFKTAFNGYSVRPPFSPSPPSISVTNFSFSFSFPQIQYLGTWIVIGELDQSSTEFMFQFRSQDC
jgi:hypothetical protein